MRNPNLFYKQSGRFNPLLFASLVAAFPLVLIVAFVYTYGSLYIPIVGIVTVILLGGFAFLTGIVCYGACRAFKVRNVAIGLFFGLIVGLFALHASWSTFVYAFLQRFADDFEGSFIKIYLNPTITWLIMTKIYETGWFSIGSSSSGDMISGIPLGICWVVEALVIVAGPIVGCWAVRRDVFCERCGEWTDEVKGLFAFNLPLAMAAVPKIKERGFSALEDLAPGDPNSGGVARLDANVCRTCKDLFALDLKRIEEKVNDKGEIENEEKVLLSGLLVNKEQYDYFKNFGATGASAEVAAAQMEEQQGGGRRSIAFNPSGSAGAEDEAYEETDLEESETAF